MGLDVYFYKQKNVRYEGDTLESPEFYHRIGNEEVRRNMQDKIEKLVLKVVNHNGAYGKDYLNKEIRPELPEEVSDYFYDSILEYDSIDSFVRLLFNVLRWYSYKPSSAYFRKVNFLYRYFGEKLENESCIVTKAEVEDIIERCKKVLDNHELAEELLPTTSGFFFGSTDYDDWYFKDVEDCQKQMEKLLEDYDERNDVMWVDMDW